MNKQSFCSDFSQDQIENYDDMLNECHEIIQIGCLTFEPADVIFNCDPVAYRCGLNDYLAECEE